MLPRDPTSNARYHTHQQVSTYAYSTLQITATHHVDVDLEAQTSAINPLLATYPPHPTLLTSGTDAANDELPSPATAANEDRQPGVCTRVLNMVRNVSWGGIIGTAAAVNAIGGDERIRKGGGIMGRGREDEGQGRARAKELTSRMIVLTPFDSRLRYSGTSISDISVLRLDAISECQSKRYSDLKRWIRLPDYSRVEASDAMPTNQQSIVHKDAGENTQSREGSGYATVRKWRWVAGGQRKTTPMQVEEEYKRRRGYPGVARMRDSAIGIVGVLDEVLPTMMGMPMLVHTRLLSVMSRVVTPLHEVGIDACWEMGCCYSARVFALSSGSCDGRETRCPPSTFKARKTLAST
ncbi:hypothetical protein DL93DRAFT_2098685 [Clavulina sp. PMI_390]|nr:hypothetical protein DL93DRAFT_2098685 [Clavulina sp. PMI_390]